MRKHNGKTHLNSEHILYLIFHMCQYSSVFFGNSTKIKYEKVCISPNNISNGYKIIKLITRFWEARREPDSKKREWFCMQCRNIFRNVRSFPDAGSLFHPSINIPRQSRGFFICGHSPRILARASRRASTVCQPRKFRYLPPVNGHFRSSA